ncbi:MAG: TetR/AcrR family transcriptional regulator [Salegentibacter sp.]
MAEKENGTEEKILNSAKKIFQQKGMDGARMQEIADEAGINKSLLHYYYRSKQLLFEAVFYRAFSLLVPQLTKVLNDDTELEEKIRNFTASHIGFILKHPYLPNFIFQELNRNPRFLEKMRNNQDLPDISRFKSQVESEVKKGNIRPISAEELFMNILSLNVFPFIGKPLLRTFVDADEEAYNQLMEERKNKVADFIWQSIKLD